MSNHRIGNQNRQWQMTVRNKNTKNRSILTKDSSEHGERLLSFEVSDIHLRLYCGVRPGKYILFTKKNRKNCVNTSFQQSGLQKKASKIMGFLSKLPTSSIQVAKFHWLPAEAIKHPNLIGWFSTPFCGQPIRIEHTQLRPLTLTDTQNEFFGQ